ncbi:MAG: OsmC family protein [candidate division WOR-3 bacterium]
MNWIKGLQFIARDELGHEIILDTKKEVGGTETGFQPVELLLVSLAGCMAFDIVSILQKKRANLKTLNAVVEGERYFEHPKRYTKIQVRFKTNQEVNRQDLIRAFELSRDKYCSILATLKNPPEIEFQLE